jgi:glycosyltransferase involved in cell wall biosynthesis
MTRGSRVLFAVSAWLPDGPIDRPDEPRKDWTALAQALDAIVVDRSCVHASAVGRLLTRTLGVAIAQAWIACSRRHELDVILTDGEHISIPLALMLKLARARARHVTIGHRLTASQKRPFFRWLKVQSHIDRIAVHSRQQYELAMRELSIPAERLSFVPFRVDTDFWRPQPVPEERLVCSAGLEFRDYPTLMRAVDGLDARVVIGAASHWSQRENTAAAAALPPNVQVSAFDYRALRDLYARAAVVVVPLISVDFQAGVTTILEAMAMGKAVIVTATPGQTDLVTDRRSDGRRAPPRAANLLAPIAERLGVRLEPNGFYVPPGDAAALRRAIQFLLDHPEERRTLGAAGRRTVERLLTIDQFTDRISALVDEAREAADSVPGARPATTDLRSRMSPSR